MSYKAGRPLSLSLARVCVLRGCGLRFKSGKEARLSEICLRLSTGGESCKLMARYPRYTKTTSMVSHAGNKTAHLLDVRYESVLCEILLDSKEEHKPVRIPLNTHFAQYHVRSESPKNVQTKCHDRSKPYRKACVVVFGVDGVHSLVFRHNYREAICSWLPPFPLLAFRMPGSIPRPL